MPTYRPLVVTAYSTEALAKPIITDILCGLCYLHNTLQVMHRDLKPANVLLKDDGRAVICDFGLAQYIYQEGEGAAGSGGCSLEAAPSSLDSDVAVIARASCDAKPAYERDAYLACLAAANDKNAFVNNENENRRVTLVAPTLSGSTTLQRAYSSAVLSRPYRAPEVCNNPMEDDLSRTLPYIRKLLMFGAWGAFFLSC
jgi:serine/threonine protein kinase